MAIRIVKGDIAEIEADVIVIGVTKDSKTCNAASKYGTPNKTGTGNIFASPYTACRVGEARLIERQGLTAKSAIHTVVPSQTEDNSNNIELLTKCYLNSLQLAKDNMKQSIAFPLFSGGSKIDAVNVAMNAFKTFIRKNDIDIVLVLRDNDTFELSDKLYSSIEAYINENSVDYAGSMMSCDYKSFLDSNEFSKKPAETEEKKKVESLKRLYHWDLFQPRRSLNDFLEETSETFSQSLIRLIAQKGMTDVEAYKRANIDRKLFSKIRNDKDYKPSKVTAIAFSIALSLNLDETTDFIGKAGFTLSRGIKFDLIIRYFIEKQNYNIFDINEALFAFDQLLLGV